MKVYYQLQCPEIYGTVYANNVRSSLGSGLQKTLAWLMMAIFSVFGYYFVGN